MFFSKPTYVKDAEQLISYAHKLLNYRRDIIKEEPLAEIEAMIPELQGLVKAREKEQSIELMKKLSNLLERNGPPRNELGWRENVEVFVVAFIVAAGVRAYILQPFKIPTGSMQPTLNGIIVTPTTNPLPNPLQRLTELAMLGRTYFEVQSAEDDRLKGMEPLKMAPPILRGMRMIDGTRVTTFKGQTFDVPTPPDPLARAFGLYPGQKIPAGAPFLRGFATVGDHVFVDRVTYNFRHPKKDDVFVFLTKNIKLIEERSGGSAGQFYIKRLVGVPGDTIRVEPPKVLINGALPELPGIRRVMKAENGYTGYTNPSNAAGEIEDNSPLAVQGNSMIWVNGGYEHVVTPNHFYAMGDNSANSWDSRNWGEVPAQNSVGRGVFVWWPFGPHWGFVR